MSIWQEYQIEDKVTKILQDIPDSADKHHLGRPFLTAYQIAIEFANRFPEEHQKIGHPVGGAGVGQRNSLAQYLALELSKHIKNHSITHIEGGFLSNQHLLDIRFSHGDDIIQSSLTGTNFTLSMFRLIS